MNKDILVIASPGGHLTQALCIMEAIDSFHLVTTGNVDKSISKKASSLIKVIDTQFNPAIHFCNFIKALFIISKIKPVAIFSTGGPVCLPFALLAKLIGIKFVFLDTLSRVEDLSNTAAFLYKYNLSNEIYCQWKSVSEKYTGVEYHGKTFDICDNRE
jgi:UDP-N-acetylglucosamine:LPS N-acetylglucosamine transferase